MEVQILFDAITDKISKVCPIGNPFYKYEGLIVEEMDVTINGVVFFTLVKISNNPVESEVTLDLWDVNGHQMKSNKPNIALELENKLNNYYTKLLS